MYGVLISVAPQPDAPDRAFVLFWALCLLPYFAACAFVLVTRPLQGRWSWVELSCILLGAFIFRIILLPLPPGLSRDVWRYLWDARVIVHGYSPYVYAPGVKILIPLRNIVFVNTRFRNILTDYPPGAEEIFVLGYLLSPQNIIGIKGLFVLFDTITCGTLSWFLVKKGHDPRSVIFYAWCPLVIVEFAVEGHSDVMAVMFMVLALVAANSSKPGGRILTGFFIGMATLTRIYPLLLLPAIVRRRDWTLPVTCFLTIFLGYLPFIILGHGNIFGFFLTYAGQQGGNAGIVQQLVRWTCDLFGINETTTTLIEYGVDVILVATVSLVVLVLRNRERINMPMAVLLLILLVFSLSSHIYPWYVPALLPWVALQTGALKVDKLFNTQKLIISLAWFYVCIVQSGYISMSVPGSTSNWMAHYAVTYGGIAMIWLGVAVVIGCIYFLAFAKNEAHSE